jgi:hypothetical protein
MKAKQPFAATPRVALLFVTLLISKFRLSTLHNFPSRQAFTDQGRLDDGSGPAKQTFDSRSRNAVQWSEQCLQSTWR